MTKNFLFHETVPFLTHELSQVDFESSEPQSTALPSLGSILALPLFSSAYEKYISADDDVIIVQRLLFLQVPVMIQ